MKVRLKEGKTAKITDIPGFLTQCMQSKVKSSIMIILILIINDKMAIIVITMVVMMGRCGRTRTL